jgi:cysteine synthase A
MKVFGVEPALSAVLSGGTAGPHPLQGIGAGFIPPILNREVLDGVIQVTRDKAFAYARRSAREEGIFIGISSGASLAAVAQKLPELPTRARVLTFSYDSGERYLSVEGLFTDA